ncbi:hypothetical protein BCR33DRAFT_308138 [Rhizoclosmatium globosum]|uniref:Uncharacterized protein n=1 Tax=Rhizoclosmatium globosum TaxID=329046 RepID=A0A1Y2C5L0_9FUNG|nr:hypothetical protein BCR33DRAFT_308138 [Rhizoclosmatium globosum]|eukprot:ORY42328.1 hypothetical protein BCR33DRAFT_308138 [Rhizoclosmatium globosum]
MSTPPPPSVAHTNYHSGGAGGVLLNGDVPAERISLRSSGSESGESNGFLVDSESDSDSASESAADSADSDTAAAQSNSDAVSSEAQQKNQAEMRRRIVAIQSDPAIPPQEKRRRFRCAGF